MLYVVKDISELKNDRNFIIIFSLLSWLTVLLQIAFIIKELKDNRKWLCSVIIIRYTLLRGFMHVINVNYLLAELSYSKQLSPYRKALLLLYGSSVRFAFRWNSLLSFVRVEQNAHLVNGTVNNRPMV